MIQMRVLQIINNHFTYGNHEIVQNWMNHFNDMINSGTTSFFELAVRSIQYTNSKIDEMHRLADNDSVRISDQGNSTDAPAVVESTP